MDKNPSTLEQSSISWTKGEISNETSDEVLDFPNNFTEWISNQLKDTVKWKDTMKSKKSIPVHVDKENTQLHTYINELIDLIHGARMKWSIDISKETIDIFLNAKNSSRLDVFITVYNYCQLHNISVHNTHKLHFDREIQFMLIDADKQIANLMTYYSKRDIEKYLDVLPIDFLSRNNTAIQDEIISIYLKKIKSLWLWEEFSTLKNQFLKESVTEWFDSFLTKSLSWTVHDSSASMLNTLQSQLDPLYQERINTDEYKKAYKANQAMIAKKQKKQLHYEDFAKNILATWNTITLATDFQYIQSKVSWFSKNIFSVLWRKLWIVKTLEATQLKLAEEEMNCFKSPWRLLFADSWNDATGWEDDFWLTDFECFVDPGWWMSVQYVVDGKKVWAAISWNKRYRFDVFVKDLIDENKTNETQKLYLLSKTIWSVARKVIDENWPILWEKYGILLKDWLINFYHEDTLLYSERNINEILHSWTFHQRKKLRDDLIEIYIQFWESIDQIQLDIDDYFNTWKYKDLLVRWDKSTVIERDVEIPISDSSWSTQWTVSWDADSSNNSQTQQVDIETVYDLPNVWWESLSCYKIQELDKDSQLWFYNWKICEFHRSKNDSVGWILDSYDTNINRVLDSYPQLPYLLSTYIKKTLTIYCKDRKENQPHFFITIPWWIVDIHANEQWELTWNYLTDNPWVSGYEKDVFEQEHSWTLFEFHKLVKTNHPNKFLRFFGIKAKRPEIIHYATLWVSSQPMSQNELDIYLKTPKFIVWIFAQIQQSVK